MIVPPLGGQVPPRIAGDPVTLALEWFPGGKYPLALARWPELTTEGAAKGAKDHADYNRALQRTSQGYAAVGDSRLFVAPIRIPAYLAWSAEQGRNPAGARAGYAVNLARRGDPSLIACRPARNRRRWCGSGCKYKQCCGGPRT